MWCVRAINICKGKMLAVGNASANKHFHWGLIWSHNKEKETETIKCVFWIKVAVRQTREGPGGDPVTKTKLIYWLHWNVLCFYPSGSRLGMQHGNCCQKCNFHIGPLTCELFGCFFYPSPQSLPSFSDSGYTAQVFRIFFKEYQNLYMLYIWINATRRALSLHILNWNLFKATEAECSDSCLDWEQFKWKV